MTVILSYYPAMASFWFVFPGNGEGCLVSLYSSYPTFFAFFRLLLRFARNRMLRYSCARACVLAFVRLHSCLRSCFSVRVRPCFSVRFCVSACTCLRAWVFACLCTCVWARVYVLVPPFMRVCVSPCMCVVACARERALLLYISSYDSRRVQTKTWFCL